MGRLYAASCRPFIQQQRPSYKPTGNRRMARLRHVQSTASTSQRDGRYFLHLLASFSLESALCKALNHLG